MLFQSQLQLQLAGVIDVVVVGAVVVGGGAAAAAAGADGLMVAVVALLVKFAVAVAVVVMCHGSTHHGIKRLAASLWTGFGICQQPRDTCHTQLGRSRLLVGCIVSDALLRSLPSKW